MEIIGCKPKLPISPSRLIFVEKENASAGQGPGFFGCRTDLSAPRSIGSSKVQKHVDVGVAKRVRYLQPHHCLTEQDVVFQREVPHRFVRKGVLLLNRVVELQYA